VAVDAAPAVQAFASGASLVDPPPVAPRAPAVAPVPLPLPLPPLVETEPEPMPALQPVPVSSRLRPTSRSTAGMTAVGSTRLRPAEHNGECTTTRRMGGVRSGGARVRAVLDVYWTLTDYGLTWSLRLVRDDTAWSEVNRCYRIELPV